jgi:hypothetical protein
MTSRTQDPAVSAGRHIAPRPCIGFLDGAGGEDALLLDHNRTGKIAPCSSSQTREAMYSTESTMFFGPSLLIMPCGRWAALPQMGKVVSTRRLSQ